MVVGFIMLAGLLLYLIVSIILILFGASIAREQGKPGWKGGLLMALIMYLILFWDWIPMRATHKYLCMKQGGFTLSKTLEQWKQENPGVAEMLIPKKSVAPAVEGNRQRYILNQRFAWDIHTSKRLFGIRERDERIVDLSTGDVQAQYIDFNSGQNQHEPKSLRDFKFWLYVDSCEMDAESRGEFYQYESVIEYLGRDKK